MSSYSAVPLKLVDRTLQGGGEILFDGERISFSPGEVEKFVVRALVEFLYLRSEQQKVWTTNGEFVQRFAVENPPAHLVAALGPEVGDCSPITIDTKRVEGSDTSGFVRPDARMVVKNLSVPLSEFREKQGAGMRVSS